MKEQFDYYVFKTKFRYGELEYEDITLLVCHNGDNPIERIFTEFYADMFGDDTEIEQDGEAYRNKVFWQSDRCAYCVLVGEPKKIPKSEFKILDKYILSIHVQPKAETVTFS